MNFYERIVKQEIRVPERFDMSYRQLIDLANNATGKFELIYWAFNFGYMQGIRAERAGKAGTV